MKISNIELFYFERHRYLPNIKHPVLTLKGAEASEEGNIIRLQDADIGETNNQIEDFINKDRYLIFNIPNINKPMISVKVNNFRIDEQSKVYLELEVTRDVNLMLENR
jgi:hypothetical protein